MPARGAARLAGRAAAGRLRAVWPELLRLAGTRLQLRRSAGLPRGFAPGGGPPGATPACARTRRSPSAASARCTGRSCPTAARMAAVGYRSPFASMTGERSGLRAARAGPCRRGKGRAAGRRIRASSRRPGAWRWGSPRGSTAGGRSPSRRRSPRCGRVFALPPWRNDDHFAALIGRASGQGRGPGWPNGRGSASPTSRR